MAFTDRLANRGSISTGYDVDNSCVFDSGDTDYMHRTPTSAGNRRTFTLSAWIKRGKLGVNHYIFQAGDGDYNQSDRTLLKFNSDDTIYWGGGSAYQRKTNRVFRDASAWYHIAMVVDTTQGTAANRLKLYINGVQETSFSLSSDPAQNFQYAFNKDDKHTIGYNHTDSVNPLDGYFADVIILDGTAAAITDLGETDEDSGIWKPVNVSGLTFGTNGTYLDFEASGNLGNDVSGGTDWTEVNIIATNQATDTPSNNFCTWNPLYAMTYPMTISEGGTKTLALDSVAQWQSSKGSMAVDNGKWYWETSNFTEMNTFIGIQSADANTTYGVPYSWNLPLNDNSFYIVDPNGRTESFSTTKATSDVWAIALNMDDGQISFYRNGALQNSTVSIDGLIGNGPYTPIITQYASAGTCSTNFGGYNSGKVISSAASDGNGYGTFEYAPPSGFYALCTKNLAEFG